MRVSGKHETKLGIGNILNQRINQSGNFSLQEKS